jgi:hypothetical protein
MPPHDGEAQICIIAAIKFNGENKGLKIKKQGFFWREFCGDRNSLPGPR